MSLEQGDDKKPFMDHIDELLIRLRRSFIYLIAGFLIGYLGASDIVKLIQGSVESIPFLPEGTQFPRIITTAPFEQVMVYMKIAMIGGVFFSSPLIALEASRFIGPGLKPHERKRWFYLGLSVYVTFLVGLFIGYRWVLPYVLSAVVRFGGKNTIDSFWTIREFVNSSLGVLLVTALLIQLPVVMTHLSSWNWVSAKTWSKGRRMAIVANAVISGILSPPDAASMLLMMLPVQLLYEAGVVFARVAEWMANEKPEQKI